MAKVTLRIYNREVEGMIEAGQLDEAIAHCQYILKTFPMHIETYLLLGKSFLEARRYTDAADIFQRALMSVPDNFVSHVGMSIIRDDEGKLDDAIWHMERAFEVQPSNPAIQGELRRLYGRRDGIEPPKIRLTRDALANMYAQGELFNQAIAEIRSVLAEDNNRPDLQVMLARAYYHAGQKVEAAEMAANLLKKYAYCMDALRVLVDVLPGTARAEDTQVYKERLRMLDPYSSFVSGSVFSSDKVADSAVTMERLEYKAGATPITPQPGWASSLGIQLPEEKAAEPASDSMAASSEEHPSVTIPETSAPAGTSADAPEPSVPAGTSATEDEVPDWMRSAGWKESNGGEQTGPGDSNVELPAEPTAQADIPEWLKAMAPHEVTDAVKPDSEPGSENPLPEKEGIPDWMTGLGTAKNPPQELSQVIPPGENDAFPDWLTAAMGAGEGTPAAGKTATAFEAPSGDMPAGEVPPVELPATELPANDENERPQAGEPPVMEPEQVVPPAPIMSKPITSPDSMFRMEDDMPFQPSGEAKPLNIEDDALAWLESLAVKQGAKEEELLTRPQDRVGEMPESVRQTSDQPSELATGMLASALGEKPLREESEQQVEEGAVTSSLPPLEEIAPVEESTPLSAPVDVTPQPSNAEYDLPSWLRDLKTGHTGPLDKSTTSPTESVETPPDWLERPSQEFETTGEASAPSNLEPIPSSEEFTAPSKDDITITSWLSKMDVEEALKKARSTPDTELAPEQAPEQVSDQVPEELPEQAPEQVSEQAPEQVSEQVQEQAPEQVSQQASEDMPDWLKRLEKPTPPVETVKNPLAESDLPDWLKQSMPPAGQQPADLPTPMTRSESEQPGLVDEAAPLSEPISPTTPEEWVTTGEKPAPVPQPETQEPIKQAPSPVSAQIQFSRSSGTGMLSRIPGEDKDADLLTKAQSELDANTLSEALHSYTALIKKGRLLDEVIHDLREALYRYPVDIIVWQTLGDAFMRANRLQDALDSYTKGEELLR